MFARKRESKGQETIAALLRSRAGMIEENRRLTRDLARSEQGEMEAAELADDATNRARDAQAEATKRANEFAQEIKRWWFECCGYSATVFFKHETHYNESCIVSVTPKLHRPGDREMGSSYVTPYGSSPAEKKVLLNLFSTIPHKGWAFHGKEGAFTIAYTNASNLFKAPEDMAKLAAFYQEHLNKLLQVEKYQGILDEGQESK